jgi:hypothetical protein
MTRNSIINRKGVREKQFCADQFIQAAPVSPAFLPNPLLVGVEDNLQKNKAGARGPHSSAGSKQLAY